MERNWFASDVGSSMSKALVDCFIVWFVWGNFVLVEKTVGSEKILKEICRKHWSHLNGLLMFAYYL